MEEIDHPGRSDDDDDDDDSESMISIYAYDLLRDRLDVNQYITYYDWNQDASDDDSMMDVDNLFDAIDSTCPIHVIRRIVANDPHQLKERNDSGQQLPLHVVLRNKHYDSDTLLAIIRLFVKKYPEGIREREINTINEQLPIHIAASAWSNNGSGKIIRFLVKQYPKGVREKNLSGELPLHILTRCMHQETATAISSCIRFLIQQYPEGLGVKNLVGQLPLHSVTMYGYGEQALRTIRILVKAYPQALREKDENGRLPLHCATGLDDSNIAMTILRLLFKHYPEAIRVKDNHGCLPVHHAVEHDFSDNVDRIQFLVKQFPESVRDKDHYGCLPLHRAASSPCAPADVVFFLAKKFPYGLREQDHEGRLPLHCAAQSLGHDTSAVADQFPERRRIQDILFFLIQQYPASVQVTDHDGYLPFHYAVSARYASVQVIQYLIQAYPLGVRERTTTATTGHLPLHLAVGSNNKWSMEIVRLLVEAFPASVQVPDHDGYLPLHRAITARTHYASMHRKVIQYLMQQFPQGLREKTFHQDHHQGCYLPLHLAVISALQNNRPPSKAYYRTLFQTLIEQYPEGLQEPATIANVAKEDEGLSSLSLPVFLAATTPVAEALTTKNIIDDDRSYYDEGDDHDFDEIGLLQLEVIFVCILQYPNFLFYILEYW